MKRFDQEAILILDLDNGVTCTSILSGFKNEWFMFTLAEQKEAPLAEALSKAADFNRATEIYTAKNRCFEESESPGGKEHRAR